MTYEESITWLYSTQSVGIKLGLENITRLLGCLGVKTAPRPGSGPVIFHVAGTNGKGSVCAMLDSVCRAAGLRSGLFTSPHLISFRERIRLDGVMISEADAAAGLSRIQELIAHWPQHPTFFEIATALALAWFQEQRAEVIVLETGLGGRLDATNAVTPAVSVITALSFDHCQYLGTTLEEIAAEKAGIFKPGVPVVSAPQPPAAADVIKAAAAQMGVRWDGPRSLRPLPWRSPAVTKNATPRWRSPLWMPRESPFPRRTSSKAWLMWYGRGVFSGSTGTPAYRSSWTARTMKLPPPGWFRLGRNVTGRCSPWFCWASCGTKT